MAKYYDKQIIQDIESRVDIVDLIGESVPLVRKGNRYWGLCPFHGEKTASFCVSRDQQMYYCFGCHEGGNIYTFLMKTQNVQFVEALQLLAQRAGVKLPESEKKGKNQRQEELLHLHKVANEYYRKMLQSDKGGNARKYLQNRGISDGSIDKFGLGYAGESWAGLSEFLTQKGFSYSLLGKSGLIRISEKNGNTFDLLRNRVIFPIFQYDQSVIAFGGRTMEKDVQPKYLNSPETPIFSKRKNLYGLSWARSKMREQNTAFLVEGYMDCLKMSQSDITNVVASLGTAFTVEQAALLHRYVEKVILVYDGDEAGQRETLRASELLQNEGISVNILTLPNEMDPDEFVTAYGKEGFLDFLKENRQSIIEFKLDRWLKKQSGKPDWEATSQLLRDLREDFLKLPGEIERDYHIETLTMKLGMTENLIRRELNSFKKGSKRQGTTAQNFKQQNNDVENYTLTERIMAAMLSDILFFQQISEQVGLTIFNDEKDQLLLKLVAQKYQNDSVLDLQELKYDAIEVGLEDRLARLQMVIESQRAADKILINDFIVRVNKLQEKRQWEDLLKQIQQMREKETHLEDMKQFLFKMNQVFFAEWKGEKNESRR